MKQTLLIIAAFLFITSAVFPQSKMNINNLVEYGDKKYAPNDDEPYTGKVFDFYENGQKKLDGRYRKGLMTGKWTYYHENGQKKYERTYKDGKNDGLGTWWYENGQKESEATYKDGERIESTRWDEVGNELSAPPGQVWSPEHGHWHDITAPSTPLSTPLVPQSSTPSAESTSEPPGPAPPGKVWSPEHGHWHDAPVTSIPQSIPLNPQSPTVPVSEPPGPAPQGKVWSPEHGHWHNAPAESTPSESGKQ
jgi:hypothetical protein